jgi:hypothetical protein
MLTAPDDLRERIIRSYWGPVARPRRMDEAPLWEKIEVYMLSLLLDDHSFEMETPIWLTGEKSKRFVKTRIVFKLERALNKLVEYLKLLKADAPDIHFVVKCRDTIPFIALSEGRGGEGKISGDEMEQSLEDVISECYRVVKLVECKYFSRNPGRCLSRYFNGGNEYM